MTQATATFEAGVNGNNILATDTGAVAAGEVSAIANYAALYVELEASAA